MMRFLLATYYEYKCELSTKKEKGEHNKDGIPLFTTTMMVVMMILAGFFVGCCRWATSKSLERERTRKIIIASRDRK
jgi:heme/copper-type cytochrome/quinol oxidase subunit 2